MPNQQMAGKIEDMRERLSHDHGDPRELHDAVAQLVAAYQQLIAQGHKVAAVGPDWIDKTYGSRAIYTQHHGYRANRQQCSVNNSERFIATDYLITSGCL